MKYKINALIVITLVGLIFPAFTHAQSERLVWAFYHPWTEADWESTAVHPLFLYDTTHAGSVTRQIGQAQNAGIDAFLVEWFNDPHSTDTLNNLLTQAAVLDFQIGAVVDVTTINTDKNQMIESLEWLITDPVEKSAYLRFDGKPVIYFIGQENTDFTYDDWWEVRHAVDPDKQTIWIAEGMDGCCIHGGIFDGMYAFDLSQNDPAVITWEQFAATRSARGWFYTPTVHPGWDDVSSEEDTPIERGTFLMESWNGAIASQASIVLIVSWNDYGHNSHIEPNESDGFQALDTLTPLIFAWKEGDPIPPPGTAPQTEVVRPAEPAPIPAGSPFVTVIVSSMNVRSEPNTTSEILGAAYEGEEYPLLGAANGWYRIPYGRQQGYVYSGYVNVGYK